jgi:circadian clock protein KaiC
MVQDKRVSTGVEELDKVLGGGFRENSVILISGNPGAGKTILSTQFLVDGGRKDEKCVYVSFAEKEEDYYNNMASMGLVIRPLSDKGLFKFLEYPTLDPEGMRAASENITRQVLEFEPQRLVIDSISAFTQTMGITETRQFLHVLFGRIMKDMDITTILIGEIPIGQLGTGFGVEEFVADGVILLKYSRVGKVERREMDIVKMRGVELNRSHFEYTISKDYNGIGLIVLPYRSDILEVPTEKVTTGVEGLDNMLYGGVYRGSMTLIEGPTGIGKTIICLQFLLENAKKGEKCLFLSFEEPTGQITRLMDSLNLNHERRENLVIESYVPEALSPLRYYGLIKEKVERLDPKMLAIDSVTAIQHTLKEEDFLEFIRYLQLLCKEIGLTIYLTALSRMDGYSVSGISTLADNIIVMRYLEEDNMLNREILVIKARGSPHDKRITRFDVKDMGLIIKS